MTDETRIEAEILRLTEASGAASSICPSDVARVLAADWRGLLGPVRRTAARLARAGRIDVLRKGKPIDPNQLRGVIRLRIRPAQSTDPEPGVPQQGVPQQGVPKQGVPKQGVPQQGVPQQGVPQQGVPQQGVPQQGVPQHGDPQHGDPQATGE